MRTRVETSARRVRRVGSPDLVRWQSWRSYATTAVLVTACAPPEQTADECQQRPRPILIRVTSEGAGHFVIDSVRRVPAPTLRFSAVVRNDPDHVHVLDAPIRGIVVRIATERHVAAGDTVALIKPDRDTTQPNVAVVVTHDGTWVPRRRLKQLVLQDTVGLLEEHGYWLAVGTVSDVEASVVHVGDPGLIELGETLRLSRAGKVGWVRGPDARLPYSAEVALQIEASSLGAGQPVTVAVTPAGPQDSMLAVLPSAVVQLSLGTAVFVAVSPNLFEARWISSSQPGTDLSFVRGGVSAGSRLVVEGLTPLVDAVRDSLQKTGGACRE